MAVVAIVALAASWYLGQLHGAPGLMLGAVIDFAVPVMVGRMLISHLMRRSDAVTGPGGRTRDGSQV